LTKTFALQWILESGWVVPCVLAVGCASKLWNSPIRWIPTGADRSTTVQIVNRPNLLRCLLVCEACPHLSTTDTFYMSPQIFFIPFIYGFVWRGHVFP
jgi:hypothetical protein